MKKKNLFSPELLISCLMLGVAVASASAQTPTTNWPGFRGANTAGVSSTAVPTSWDLASSRNVAWKTPIPGLAHSSPMVWGDRVYVTVHQGMPRMKRHVKASHASATPATNGQVIAALMGSEGLFCFDMNGNLKWRTDLGVMDVGLVDDPGYQWGPASSPVIFGDRVIVQDDRHEDSFLSAYDLATGKEVWRTRHDGYPSWATLILRTQTQLVGIRTEG